MPTDNCLTLFKDSKILKISDAIDKYHNDTNSSIFIDSMTDTATDTNTSTDISSNDIKLLDPKEQLLDRLMNKFYHRKRNINLLLTYILPESITTETGHIKRIPIRILNWFVTNYAKKHNIQYIIKGTDGTKRNFYVHASYKSQLMAFSKDMFDAFKRGKRIIVNTENPGFPAVETTLAQLSFFRWAISNKVLDYVKRHITEIENDLNDIQINKNPTKHELSVSATKTLHCNKCQVVVKFTHI